MMVTERTYIGGTIEQFSSSTQSLQSIGILFYYYNHKTLANIMDPGDLGEVTDRHQISEIKVDCLGMWDICIFCEHEGHL